MVFDEFYRLEFGFLIWVVLIGGESDEDNRWADGTVEFSLVRGSACPSNGDLAKDSLLTSLERNGSVSDDE